MGKLNLRRQQSCTRFEALGAGELFRFADEPGADSTPCLKILLIDGKLAIVDLKEGLTYTVPGDTRVERLDGDLTFRPAVEP